jgi:hypothetical protein
MGISTGLTDIYRLGGLGPLNARGGGKQFSGKVAVRSPALSLLDATRYNATNQR